MCSGPNTQPLKRHAQEVAPYITVVINLSKSIDEVSPNLKEALLKPLLKKIDLEPVFKNYSQFPQFVISLKTD